MTGKMGEKSHKNAPSNPISPIASKTDNSKKS